MIRPTTRADLSPQYDVFRAAIGEVFRRHRFTPPDPPREAFEAQQAHLLEHDGERCFVAEEEGRVVAFCAAMARDDAWYLSSLFVVPGRQGAGLGRLLLEHAWGDGFTRRQTMTDSIQPASNGLYARLGLIPTTPVLHLAGRPAVTERPTLTRAEPEPEALERLDLAAYGFSRAVDHAHWSRHARGTLWLRAGEPVAYSYAWEHGRIGPIAGLDGEAAAQALRAELAAVDSAIVVVPGTSSELVTAALWAGLRITGPPGLLLLSQPKRPPRALAVSGYSLF